MSTIRPSNGASIPEKMVNPIFPPMSQLTTNSIRPPAFPPNISIPSAQHSPQTNAPIFPPTIPPSSANLNPKVNPAPTPPISNVNSAIINPILSVPNKFNTNTSSTPSPSNVNNSIVNPIVSVPNTLNTNTASVPKPIVNTFNTHTNPTPPLPNNYNTNGTATPPPNVLNNAKTNPTPPPPASQAFDAYNTNANPVPPPNILSTRANPTPPLFPSNTYNTNPNPTPPPASFSSTGYSASPNPTPPATNVFNSNPNPNSTPTPPLPNVYNTNPNTFVPPPYAFNTNMNTVPPANILNTNSNFVPPPNVLNTNSNPTPPLPTAFNTNPNSTPAPPPLSTNYNSIPNQQPITSQPTVRPMYPTPASAYRPQVPQQLPQLIPQTTNQNMHPTSSVAAPPTAPPTASSTYPYPQYNYNSNLANPTGHPGQPPFVPQPMPYPMGGNTAGPTTQYNTTNNNLNGPLSNNDIVDLLKEKNVISAYAEEPPVPPLLSEENQQMNCSPDVMRCSLNVLPQTKELLNKSRLPLGILIHPFKDLESLSVIQGTKIVRCDSCKSYINPFITFLDTSRWRCSICYRVNDLPQEFLYDPITKTYGDPSRRPEVRFGTVEYTATADYMARPPQPAMYLFLLDVSHNAIQTGYLQSFCDVLIEGLIGLPGDARTQIGFITYDSRIHYYDLSDRDNGTFRIMIAPDLDGKPEDFLPMPDCLMVTLNECRSTIETFLNELPKIYENNSETDSALGAALQIAEKLLSQTGGRITVVQTRIPNLNPGALNEAMNPTSGSAGKEPTIICPTSDFYKKLALDFASLQIACDLFLLNSHHIDLATLSCISKYSGGEVKYYPGFHSIQKPHEVERFENDVRRYLQRKIGFEAVMRLRTPPAVSIHTFHGNGFVRSVDLLVLPNINPDAAFGIQLSIDDSLTNYTSITFQAALLYTSSKSERRIRVHTLSLPVSSNLTEICSNADQEAVVSLIAKMAADRSTSSSLQDAREAMSNVSCDILKACLSNNLSNRAFSLLVPYSLRLIPLYMLSMIKSTAFRAGSASKLDDRAYYLDLCKTLPIQYLLQIFYPDLYPIHTIEDKSQIIQDGEDELHIPPRVHLSFQHIDSHGAYILDTTEYIFIYIGKAISDHFVQNVFNAQTFSALPMDSYSLPELENPLSMKIHNFLSYLIQSRPHGVAIHIMREDSSNRHLFTRYLVDDKSESTMSYVEFLRYIREQIVK